MKTREERKQRRQERNREEYERTARWKAAALRRCRQVEVTSGFALGFSIFWGFACGGLVLGAIVFVLNLLGCGILLSLL